MSRFFLVIAPLTFLVFGGALGFFGGRIIYPPPEARTSLLTAPIPTETLKNIMFDGFSAEAMGVVVKKETDKFVIKQGDEEMILHVVFNGLTTFKKDGQYISYEEMQVGDYVTGGISIRGDEYETGGYEITAHQFRVWPLP